MRTTCCIAGGGPAGLMLGFLLARAGVDVVVLEKHADFFRDFRGDTIHPSTLELMAELGLLDDFLALRHDEVHELSGSIGDRTIKLADFHSLPTRCKFIAMMPQWDFLDFLAERARRYPTFHLLMNADVTGLLERDAQVVGVRATTPSGELEVSADLVVAADGRDSTVRRCAGLQVTEFGVPIDVLWFRLNKSGESADEVHALGYVRDSQLVIALDRGEYWQVGALIRKGGLAAIQAEGLPAFRQRIAHVAPPLAGAVDQLTDWDQVKLLSVQVNRLDRWYRPGLLCIGDAAHAMSPAFGVGVNYAIQDAVATANLLAAKLGAGDVGVEDLAAVQRRRERPTRRMQDLQVFLHRRLFSGIDPERQLALPAPLRWLAAAAAPLIGWRMARLIGLGFLPEHVATANVFEPSAGGASVGPFQRPDEPGFNPAYRGTPPWDIGRPQPEFVRLEEAGELRGAVLDVGCGTGEHVLYLAQRGHEAVGLDSAPLAIERARNKATERGIAATFVVADALDLQAVGRTFDTVIDSGLFHIFEPEVRPRFVASLGQVLPAGGTYVVLGYSDQDPGRGPHGFSPEDLREVFAAGWHVNYIREARFDILELPGAKTRAWLASITRQ